MNRIVSILGLAIVPSVIGCVKEELGSVSGTVTLDGKPLDRALVRFIPVSGERESIAQTDENGKYTLQNSTQKSGIKVGEHTVTITTAVEPVADEGNGKQLAARTELLPVKYNLESRLKVTVEAGENVFDWKLDSEGEIFERAEVGQEPEN